MASDRVDREQLSEESWELLQEAIRTGQMTLKSGEIRTLQTKELAQVLRYVAALSAVRKRRPIPLPEEFMPKATETRHAT